MKELPSTPESSQARMTLVEALRYHASLMIAPEVAPKVRALLNDASTVMWAAAEALSTPSETKPSMDISFCPGCEKEWNRATPSAELASLPAQNADDAEFGMREHREAREAQSASGARCDRCRAVLDAAGKCPNSWHHELHPVGPR